MTNDDNVIDFLEEKERRAKAVDEDIEETIREIIRTPAITSSDTAYHTLKNYCEGVSGPLMDDIKLEMAYFRGELDPSILTCEENQRLLNDKELSVVVTCVENSIATIERRVSAGLYNQTEYDTILSRINSLPNAFDRHGEEVSQYGLRTTEAAKATNQEMKGYQAVRLGNDGMNLPQLSTMVDFLEEAALDIGIHVTVMGMELFQYKGFVDSLKQLPSAIEEQRKLYQEMQKEFYELS